MKQEGICSKLKYISWIPAAILMVIIFGFSSKPANDSEKSSMLIANRIFSTYEKIVDHHFDEGVKEERLLTIDFYVRKTAHFTEYALLAFCIGFHLWISGWKLSSIRIWSVAFTAIYAATDEFHQLFVPGRSGQIRDVLIDTTGALAGMLILSGVLHIYIYYMEKRRDANQLK